MVSSDDLGRQGVSGVCFDIDGEWWRGHGPYAEGENKCPHCGVPDITVIKPGQDPVEAHREHHGINTK